MPVVRKSAHGTAADQSAHVSVLDTQGYKRIRNKPHTIEIYLASPLFRGKITANSLKKVLSRKAPAFGEYNAVFHFRNGRKRELTSELEKAWLLMPSERGKWFIKARHSTKKAVTQSGPKAASKGLVKTSIINSALKALAEA